MGASMKKAPSELLIAESSNSPTLHYSHSAAFITSSYYTHTHTRRRHSQCHYNAFHYLPDLNSTCFMMRLLHSQGLLQKCCCFFLSSQSALTKWSCAKNSHSSTSYRAQTHALDIHTGTHPAYQTHSPLLLLCFLQQGPISQRAATTRQRHYVCSPMRPCVRIRGVCKLWFGLAEIRIYKQHHAHKPNSASSGNAQGAETEQIFVQVIFIQTRSGSRKCRV